MSSNILEFNLKQINQNTVEHCQYTQLRKLKIITVFQGSLKIRILTRVFSIFMINNFFGPKMKKLFSRISQAAFQFSADI